MKILKIVPCYPYTSQRIYTSRSPTHIDEWKKCINNLVDGEKNVDPGIELDLILYRMFNSEEHENPDIGKEFLDQFDGQDIFRGKIKVIDFVNKRGNGFVIIPHAINYFWDKYDYLIFQEDDHSIIKSGKLYALNATNQMEEKRLAGGIVFAPMAYGEFHFGAFFALIPMQRLKYTLDNFEFPYDIPIRNEKWVCNWYILNTKLQVPDFAYLDNFSNAPDNYKQVVNYSMIDQRRITPGKHLFHVGV